MLLGTVEVYSRSCGRSYIPISMAWVGNHDQHEILIIVLIHSTYP